MTTVAAQPLGSSTPLEAIPVDVAIHGRGIVAHTLALALLPLGLRVALVGAAPQTPEAPEASETPEPPRTRGADLRTFFINPASSRLLQSVGVWDALPSGSATAVHDMHVTGDAAPAPQTLGAAVARLSGAPNTLHFSAWQQSLRELGWIVDAAALEAALLAAVAAQPVITHHAVSALDVLGRALGGEPAPSLVAVAEGQGLRSSPLREAMGITLTRTPYAQHAVAARLRCSTGHLHTAHQWFLAPDVLALLPFDQSGEPGFGLVWSVSSEHAQALLAMDAAAFDAALNSAVDAAAPARAVGQLSLASARAAWPLALARADHVTGEVHARLSPRGVRQPWVLLGDAAHVVHPLAGQGLNLGLGDVQALVEALAHKDAWRSVGDPRVLAHYARQRAAPVAAMQAATDGLQQLFANPTPWARDLRNLGLGLVDQASPLKRWLVSQALGR
jgi:ubiquinone biosynthesis UbiH/UbiF/VisC/COQ6 family hydroxylase